tara:strand:- start:5563 stop:5832 length:270 start_codon:yes stop_codon:yes gene_type:complete
LKSLTKDFLLKRGYCCNNNCKNCPYKNKKMKYKTIKSVLKTSMKKNVNTLWTWDKKDNNFTQIYKNYNNELPIYTASQLLEEIIKEENK